MGLRRPGATKDYEEMNGANVPTDETATSQNNFETPTNCPEFEMTSVSVVPDGKMVRHMYSTKYQIYNHFLYIV